MSWERRKTRYLRFWNSLAFSDAKLRVFRVIFFGIFALDAFLQIKHAPRYGAGDFNVPHTPLFDFLPMPSRSGMLVVFLMQAYLAARIALGAATRRTYVLMTAFFAYGYFISQLNSYQHHYLLFLLLTVSCLIDWPGPSAVPDADGGQKEKQDGAEGKPDKGQSKAKTKGKKGKKDKSAKARANKETRSAPERRPQWGVRLFLMQLSVVYFFAAVAKMDALWTSGATMHMQISDGIARDLMEGVGWGTAATLVLLGELFLAIGLHVRWLWIPVFLTGVGLHIGIEVGGFKIGLFSYFMLSCYLLLIPDVVYEKAGALWNRASAPIRSSLGKVLGKLSHPAVRWGTVAAAAAVAAATFWQLPFDQTPYLVVFATLALGIELWPKPRHFRLSLGHVAAALVVLLLYFQTTAARDYYRFWGGASRRLGDLDTAIVAYRGALHVDPDYAPSHNAMGNLFRRKGSFEKALYRYQRAAELAPNDWRPHLGMAQVFHSQRRGELAVRAAERTLELNPDVDSARTILQYWKK